MLKDKNIRFAIESDSASILQIYAPYITDSVITFEYEVPTITKLNEKMANIQKKYPWLVCEINGNIVGYAYASCFREREAYKWSVDFSVYINPQYHRKNIGKALYFALFELLKLQGCYNAYAGVTLPNIKSEGLHESFGFKAIGIYENVGYKFGSWHDVKWYGLKINEHDQAPVKPKSINEISNTNESKTIIEKAEQMIKIY
jgi:phosphinothricin acetyltransferase